MNEGKKYIGFDLGAESGRCVVAILKENKVELNEVHRFPTRNYRNESGFHWNINSIFNEIITGLIKAKNNFGNNFESIGIDTWGVDYALIDENKKLLNDPFHYRDDRTDGIMEEAFLIVGKEKIYNTTGAQFQQYNTIFQLLSEKKNNSEKLNKAMRMLLIPDYLNFLLSGEMKAEYTIASTTGLIDPKKRDWSWDLIDSFDLPKHIFSEIVEPGEKLGNLLPAIANKTGLSSNIPIIASAGHDTASAVVSIPAKKGNWAFLSSGTWSLMGVELNEPIVTTQAMKYNFTNEGGIDKTVRFLQNIIGLWPVQECRRYWLESGKEYSYEELTGKARAVGYTERWLNLNNQRFLKAGDMPEKIIAYLKETKQNITNDEGEIIRIILESLAFKYKNTIDEIKLVSGKKIDYLHAVGGGIRNELLCQLTADSLELDFIAGPIEGTIIGNIGVQAIASNAISNLNEWREVVSNSFEVKVYKPKNTQYFRENRGKFEEICNQNI